MNKIVSESEIFQTLSLKPAAIKKICIVTGEISGPDFNGGIGTVNRALALFLRDQGHQVDILYTKVSDGIPFSFRESFADHVKAYRKLGISLTCIDNKGKWNDWLAKSYLAMDHLLQERYDLVFFDDTHGTAYYPLLARRTGNSHLGSTTMCVVAHSAFQWIADLNEIPIVTIEALRLTEMERRSIELADVVRAPSAYILRKYRSYGWAVPDSFVVLPNLVSTSRELATPKKRVAVKEIVFFGRLETRKGLWMFLRALDRLKFQLVGHIVTFLGKETVENEVSTAEAILRRSAAWPFKIRLLNDFDRDQALNYLRGEGRVAVMPSPEDNCPSVVLECLEQGIPFLASSGSGTEELLDNDSRSANLFDPSVEGLCAKLATVLSNGAVTGHPSFDHARLKDSFCEWLALLLSFGAKDKPTQLASSAGPRPILVVIVPPEFDPSQAVNQLLRLIETYGGRVDLEVLTGSPASFRAQLARSTESSAINVSDLVEFATVAKSLANRPSTVVGLCHITQLLSPGWMQRATACFRTRSNVSALTGMVGPRAEPPSGERPQSFVSTPTVRRNIERYLMGDAAALFPLAQETNSGFVIIRSELFAKVDGVLPLDERYGRLKRMEDWVHEILLKLHLSGQRFEVLPDELVEQQVRESRFEVFRLGPVMRATPQALPGETPGADRSILARLAVDTFLVPERRRANSEYLAEIARTIGNPAERLDSEAPWEDQVKHLAMIAHAGGQIELALDLAMAVASPGGISSDSNLAEWVRNAAKTVRLCEMLATTQYQTVNLSNDWSLKILEVEREIELHANPASNGRAALEFSSVDLSDLDTFRCPIRVPFETSNPIRFRVDLISLDQSNRFSAEIVARAAGAAEWTFEIPMHLRTECKVVLGVEMADHGDTSLDAFTRWSDPRFIRNVRGGKV